MAPKRKSTSTGGTPKKLKPAAACSAVTDLLVKIGVEWMSGKSVISNVVTNSLGVTKAERHADQVTVVDMIFNSMKAHEKILDAEVAELKGPVDAAAQIKEEREESLEAAKLALSALETVVEEKKAAVSEATKDVNKKKAAVEEKEESLDEGKKMLAALLDMKSKFEIVKAAVEVGEGGKVSGSAPAVKVPKGFMASLSGFGIEMEMMKVIPGAFAKDPEKRSEFEKFSLDSFGKAITSLQEVYGAQAQSTQEADNKVREGALASVQDELTQASEVKGQAAAALTDAKSAAKVGKQNVDDAQKAVANYMKDMKKNMSAYDAALAKLAAFTNGPLAAFESLNADPIVEPEPAAEA